MGVKTNDVEFWLTSDEFDHNYLDVEILADPITAHIKYAHPRVTFYNTFMLGEPAKLTGEHDVSYHIITTGLQRSIDDKYKAKGTIRIDFTGVDDKILEQKASAVAAAGDQAFGKRFTIPPPGRLNQGLAQQLERMTKQNNPQLTAVRVIVKSDEWTIVRNENTGIVTGRVASAAVLSKRSNGKCMIEYDSTILQEYVANKFLAPGAWMAMSSAPDPQQIDCNNAFKK